MAEISRVALFGKLNSLAYRAIEAATVFCKMRGNPYVELAHWLHQILQLPDSDVHKIIKQFNLEPSRLARDLTETLDRFPRGSSSISDLSSHLEDATQQGWVYATLMFKDSQVRTGYLIVGMIKTKTLNNALLSISKEFGKINADTLIDKFAEVVAGSPEDSLRASDGTQVGGGAVPGEASGAMAPAAMGKQEALKQFSIDLTERARKGEIDPIVGRDEEIRQLVDILMRRRQNNPILTGEAGVGKTAVVEGFALRIASGDVPPSLKDVSLRSLDIGLLQAGASMKGEFENRLRQVIEEVQSSEQPIILFIDEAHTLIGAGGAAGTGDAANLLKPALARGKLRTVAATTWAEYKKHIEKDPALTRRFQVVQVGEPSEDKAILMMRGMASTLEQHHRVQILDEALEASVRLSHRYIPARQLPDKSVSLLDTTCARVAISQHAVPAEVEDCRRKIEALEVEQGIIAREKAVGVDTTKREKEVDSKLAIERERLKGLEQRWTDEKTLVDEILDIRGKLRGQTGKVEGTHSKLEKAADKAAKEAPPVAAPTPPLTEAERAPLLAKLTELQAKLTALQGESPLILPTVDEQAVASVVADWTGIPVGRMVKNEVEAVLKLAETLGQRVIGQDHAMKMIARRIQTSRAQLENPNKPIGVFLLAGTSGVGKTETALALAEALYGGEQNVITINMSEFQEAHTVSTLKGSPPGYVGYGEGGILTEAVRRKPYSVVLLDEVEKAHGDVHELFFQVFDKGWMEDGEGRVIDFKNTLILLTSNAGSDLIMNMCKDPELLPDPEAIAKSLRDPLLKVFPAALLGRLVTIPYYPLSDSMIAAITRLQLRRIEKRIGVNHKVPFTYSDEVLKLIVSRCTELESGGRMIDSILTNTMLPAISEEILKRMMVGSAVKKIEITAKGSEFHYNFD
ncbi:type VI secretion ATPase, ClpV1 family [Pirellula staleyi DSM 6068]|uniref:Type VI secretion ATPase, ClpV1 family n=1 Tax=Pirellula staleyi (strain ATCC 27377 / DSM 6068 / ICPB 4128) TaxID=530564 RepID=D2QZM9_PIRSD|nr:type VI secretion system ATPase TssH [Pirellula staleyi]ADB16512.1 type VI secretion ATPase, ClpV1 family [Pirellula staleyi DSM 6068]